MQAAGKQLQPILPAGAEQPGMTEDELRHALLEGEKSGIVESKERTMVEGVFYLGDRPLGTFMTHRSDIQWLDINDSPQDIRAKALEYRSQRCFPVVDGTLDAIIGAAYLEDIILDLASASPAGLRAITKKAIFAPETMPALKAFESFRRGKADFLLVMDEYGGFAGMVRVHDLMEEIVGELTTPGGETEQAVQQEDGTWLVDGGLNIDDAARLLSLPGLSAASGDYHTLAGFVLSLAGELPRTGDSFVYQGCRFTVVDMDGNRIDKVMIKAVDGAAPDDAANVA
jgi:putative hemolysin